MRFASGYTIFYKLVQVTATNRDVQVVPLLLLIWSNHCFVCFSLKLEVAVEIHNVHTAMIAMTRALSARFSALHRAAVEGLFCSVPCLSLHLSLEKPLGLLRIQKMTVSLRSAPRGWTWCLKAA